MSQMTRYLNPVLPVSVSPSQESSPEASGYQSMPNLFAEDNRENARSRMSEPSFKPPYLQPTSLSTAIHAKLSDLESASPSNSDQDSKHSLTHNDPQPKTLMLSKQWLSSLWKRLRTTWNAYSLGLIIVITLAAPPIAVAVAYSFQRRELFIHIRCAYEAPQSSVMPVSIQLGAMLFIPVANYITTCAISLVVAIMCSSSRKRVMKAASSGRIVNLASTFMLPCYEVVWYAIAFLAAVGVVISCSSFSLHSHPIKALHHRSFSSASFPLIWSPKVTPRHTVRCDLGKLPSFWILQILPTLMMQRCISRQAVRRALGYPGLWVFVIVACLFTPVQPFKNVADAFFIGFYGFLIGLYMYTKFVVKVRPTFDFYFLLAMTDALFKLLLQICALTKLMQPWKTTMLSLGNISSSIHALVIVSLLVSLREDTRYWLGIDDSLAPVTLSLGPNGERPQGAFSSRRERARFVRAWMQKLSEFGYVTNCSTQTSVYNVHQMIEEHRKHVVDFSTLRLEGIIAQGATAVVMRGVMRNPTQSQCRQQPETNSMTRMFDSSKPKNRRTVAIALKVYLSVQGTDDELYRFSRETALNGRLSHPNIVHFFGLCVIPPLISLVFEYCDGGSLDLALKSTGKYWSLAQKIKAWLDACRAVAYLHSFSPPLLHRDIKTDNFLLDKHGVLKLTDFGEANILRPRSDGTMTITGTVDFMAPEMILGGKTARYDTGVDIYSLMITLWQILMPEQSPWGKKTHLEVYHAVLMGERPPIYSSKISDKCAEILRVGWAPDPARVSAREIVPLVEQLWLLSMHQKIYKRTKKIGPNSF
uniref:Protein kinase putative n=1 Tax=Albugo laibachii Nc14 TaxID=890382 RepID=F0WJC8_9STRA|nr:protein kinase putative [Albugo laibachii Nc14]|eukprot:CCA21375.1 protein kinase putative [Albugo laibachii Nc14]